MSTLHGGVIVGMMIERENIEPTRLLIVDPDATVRRGLQMRLELEPDLTVIGEAGDVASAVRLAEHTCPDVILLDHAIPGVDGIAATTRLTRCGTGTVIVLSLNDDLRSREEARAAGVLAFVGKHEGVDLLLETIRRARSGEIFVPLK